MFCSVCGNAVPEGSSFCATCGSPVQSRTAAPSAQVPSASAMPTEPPVPVAPAGSATPATPQPSTVSTAQVTGVPPYVSNVQAFQQPCQPVAAAPAKPKKKPVWLFILVGILAVLALGTLLVNFAASQDTPSSTGQPSAPVTEPSQTDSESDLANAFSGQWQMIAMMVEGAMLDASDLDDAGLTAVMVLSPDGTCGMQVQTPDGAESDSGTWTIERKGDTAQLSFYWEGDGSEGYAEFDVENNVLYYEEELQSVSLGTLYFAQLA